MNLPDTAIQFLNAFRGLLSDRTRDLGETYNIMPVVHCHCFTRELEPQEAEKDIREASPLHFDGSAETYTALACGGTAGVKDNGI